MCSSTSNVSQPGHDIFSTPENDDFYAAYKYEQLDPSKQEIRLLRILPDRGDGIVKCELLTKTPLDSVKKTYSALSYCAGDPKRTQCIIVDGHKFRAFANLAHALAEARFFWKKTHGTRELLLWVDQICISQHNLLERSQQVALMREIYSHAEEVLICLSTRKISSRGMHWLHDLCQNVPLQGDDLDEQLIEHLLDSVANAKFVEDWLAVYDVFESPWWTRSWVYQEFMSAGRAHFLFNKESIAWAAASPILDTYLSVVRYLILEDVLFSKIQERFGANTPECHRMLRIRERSIRAEQAEGLVAQMVESKRRWSGPTDLVSLLSCSRHYATSDVRDKIYAMLGLAYPGYRIIPNYAPEWSLRALLIHTAMRIIEFENSLEILTHASDRGALTSLLPSWVPDWTCQEGVRYRMFVKQKLFPTKTIDPRWNKANASFLEPTTSDCFVALKAWGTYIDTLITPAIRDAPRGDRLGAFYTVAGNTVMCTSEARIQDQLWLLCGSQRPMILRRGEEGYCFICATQTLEWLQGSGILLESAIKTFGIQRITIR
ncbi:heterokaryon incompatibility protein-domain-containing protein [Bipolaris maydis]|nr:heterokaryon incompatibility protein-domain-containing protein [Bipolaris maydis]